MSRHGSPCPRDKDDKKGGNIEEGREGERGGRSFLNRRFILFELELKLKLDNRRSKFYFALKKKERKKWRRDVDTISYAFGFRTI